MYTSHFANPMKTENMIIQIQWTAASEEEARRIAAELIQNRWAACVNLISPVESLYLWNGVLETSREVKVLIKTVDGLFNLVQDYILKHCSYEVPEISAIPLEKGNRAYFDWVLSSVKEKR